MIRAVLWDNDGVLVDTEGLYFLATAEVLRDVGFDLDERLYRQLFLIEGRGCWHLLSERGMGSDEIAAVRAVRNARYAALLRGGRPLLPGVEETLRALAGRFRMGVVTSCRRQHFDLIHQDRALDRYFEFVLTREDYGESKPHPEPYLKAAAALGLAPRECVAVEDSERGVTAAKAAGCLCFAIPTAHTRETDLSGADRSLAAVGDVLALLS